MHTHTPTIAIPRSLKPRTMLIATAVVALVAVGLIALTQTGTTSSATATLGLSEAGSTVTLEMGGELTVTLPANPSTGYGWVVTAINPAVLTQIGEPEFSAESDLVGAGGTMTLHFEGTAVGQDSLQLDYLRPWEDAQPIDTFLVTVDVR